MCIVSLPWCETNVLWFCLRYMSIYTNFVSQLSIDIRSIVSRLCLIVWTGLYILVSFLVVKYATSNTSQRSHFRCSDEMFWLRVDPLWSCSRKFLLVLRMRYTFSLSFYRSRSKNFEATRYVTNTKSGNEVWQKMYALAKVIPMAKIMEHKNRKISVD